MSSSTGATTAIEIQSNVAVLLGKAPFTSIVDNDKFAQTVESAYNNLVPAELSSLNWKFSRKIATLAQIAGFDPDFAQWNTAYALPNDLLSVVRVYPYADYQIFKDRIYTNTTSTLKTEYTYQTPVTAWSDPFKIYMANSIAHWLANGVAENPRLIESLERNMMRWKSIAMFVDGQNSPNVTIVHKPYITVRSASSRFPFGVR